MTNIDIENTGHDFIHEVLEGFYHLDKIHTVGFEVLGEKEDSYKAVFSFLPYNKVNTPLNHVSANQIHEGIMEVLYLVVASIVKSGKVENISFQDFLEMRAIAIFREFEIKYKREIYTDQENILEFSILNNKDMKGQFSTIEIGFSGFCVGKTKVLIKTADLVDITLKN